MTTQDNNPSPLEGALSEVSQGGPNDPLSHLRQEQNLALGIVGGLIGMILGAVIWAGIVIVTEYQLGLIAIVVGFLTGFGVQILGKGIEIQFSIVGAVLSGIGCLLGNAIIIVYFVASTFGISYIEVLNFVGVQGILEAMIETFEFMDLVFYGIAIYTGFRSSLRG